MKDEIDDLEVGRRLQALRKAVRLSKSQMADRHGIDRTNYGRFEAGRRQLPIEVAVRIAEQSQVSLDWLYRGRSDHLSVPMNALLRPFLDGTHDG
jgi:transcriptional regulator with XRE-family HTH domain